jgi:hypothetical protein
MVINKLEQAANVSRQVSLYRISFIIVAGLARGVLSPAEFTSALLWICFGFVSAKAYSFAPPKPPVILLNSYFP